MGSLKRIEDKTHVQEGGSEINFISQFNQRTSRIKMVIKTLTTE